MILSHISWSSAFEITFFDEFLKTMNKFTIGEFPIFAKLFGNLTSFGNWQMTDLINVVLVSTVFVGVLGKVKFNDMLNGFGAGAKKALTPAFIASILYVLVYISAYNPFIITIVKPILELDSHLSFPAILRRNEYIYIVVAFNKQCKHALAA